MFKRTITAKLLEWKNSDSRKPLILRGARQVGKTTIVNQFGSEFDNYLYYNMELTADRATMEMEIAIDQLVTLLFAAKGKARHPGSTLLFIDEIQNSPVAIARLRYFYEQAPWIHVIAAGSLLENLVDVKASFPVGRVQYLAVRPCSFYEFLDATGHDNWLTLINTNPELLAPFHTELMALFQQYMLVGGMPEIVAEFARKRDIVALDDLFESLVTSYQDDVEKYVRGNKLTEVIRYILSVGWSYAGEAVTLSSFGKSNYQSREVGEAFRLLEKAMLTELVYPTSSPLIPIIPELSRKPKLIWFDTGLVTYQAHVRNEIIGAQDVIDVWRGRIAEQVVAQELLSLSDKVGDRRAFWSRPKSSAEVDFIYMHNGTIVPIEVKNCTNAHLRSLQVFMDQSPNDVAVRVWSGPYSRNVVTTPAGKEFTLINLPFYLVGIINRLI